MVAVTVLETVNATKLTNNPGKNKVGCTWSLKSGNMFQLIKGCRNRVAITLK